MNRDTRDRLLLPLLLPVGGLVVIALLVVGFSRILLSVTPTAATATAVTVALGILAVAVAVATRPTARFSNLLSMVTGVAGVALLAGGIALAAAGPKEEPAAGGEGGGGGQAGPLAPIVAVSASSGAVANGFDQTKLSAPAGTAFVIRFDNQDTGVPHNVGVYRDEGYAQPIAKGDIITGPARSDLAVDAVPAGTYYFRCDVHPTTMTGRIEVGGAPA
ncbi:MAG: cupredoxin domain-containing protein [Actinobacteria bacterium]|nr:cupredoxin domain-containing protein [Actinomycetota bacterium]